MKRERIVVTGMGVVSCLGDDVDLFYEKLLNGTSGITEITGFDCKDLSSRIAGEIKNFNPGEYLDQKLKRRVDTCMSYAMVAGKKALEMSQLMNGKEIDKEKCGVIIGTGMGGMSVFVDGINTMQSRGPRRVSPFFIPYILTNMSGALLAMEVGFKGPNYSVSTACATGNNAIISAANHIRVGDAKLMLCGGVEAAIIPMGVAGFCACKALSTRNDEPKRASRPWDRARDGFVMGEGAGILVLESLDHALQRGAPIFAEYLGHGLSCDAHHITEPLSDGSGVTACIRAALKDARVTPEQVEYINAHATSTPLGDMAEINAMKKVFPNPENITINATKSLVGHCLGAAAGIEAIVTVKALMENKVHPTLNLDDPDPDLTFDVPTKIKTKTLHIGMSNSFGFGGHNASVIFGKYETP